MATCPQKDHRAQTGSNVPGYPILAHRLKLITKQQKPFQDLLRSFKRTTKGLFTKRELYRAVEIATDVKNEWFKLSVNLDGDSSKIDAAKSAAREKLNRALSRALPNYGKLRSFQREHSREYRRLVKSVFGVPPTERLHVSWGNGVVTPNPNAEEFGPPFSLYDVQSEDPGGVINRNESFVIPESGDLVVDSRLHFEGDGAFIWGLPEFTYIRSWASCAVPFTTPTAGRLRVGGALQNFYSRLTFSVSDDFGFSSGEAYAGLMLFIDIVRPAGEVMHHQAIVFHEGLISPGAADLSYTMPTLDTSVPYTVGLTTDLPFPPGEEITIVVGTETTFAASLDDMTSHFDATVWFRLNKIVAEVV